MFIALICLGSLLVLLGVLDIVQSHWGVFDFYIPHFDPEVTILVLGVVVIVYAVIFRLKLDKSSS